MAALERSRKKKLTHRQKSARMATRSIGSAQNSDGLLDAKALPERGFHYFPSPESGDDNETIAYHYLYCATAVAEWPDFRRWLERTGANSPVQCEQMERNAIDMFREVRDTILTAIDTNNLAVMAQRRLLDRLVHAHAYIALHANPAHLMGYRNMVWSQMNGLSLSDLPQRGDFIQALWEGKWNSPSNMMPAEVTRRETRRISRLHARDGVYNTGGRRDLVAKAQEQVDPLWAAERIGPMFPATEPHYKPPDELAFLQTLSGVPRNDFLSPMKRALTREATRHLFLRAGVKAKHASFGVRMIHDGAKQKDNPTAWKAIYRKRPEVLMEARKLFEC
jgi:hypothetical protein